MIRAAVAEEFGVDGTDWARGRRSDSISRAVAAYLARRCFGYRSKDVTAALGYSSAGGVGQAIGRVEAAGSRCGRRVEELARRLTNG
jgi:ribosomal protein L4